MKAFKNSFILQLPSDARCTTGEGYAGHCLNRQQLAQYLSKATGMNFRNAYKEINDDNIKIGKLRFTKFTLLGKTGWWTLETNVTNPNDVTQKLLTFDVIKPRFFIECRRTRKSS